MKFILAKFGVLMVIAASGQASVTARSDLATPALILYSNPHFRGDTYTYPSASGGICHNLSPEWQGKTKSARVGAGWVCTLYSRPACTGTAIFMLATDVDNISKPSIFDSVLSLVCTLD